MPEEDQARGAGLKGLLAALLAAIVIVNGLLATLPDACAAYSARAGCDRGDERLMYRQT